MCKDCFNNCGDDIISDKCVKYTGPDITFLDICTGDNLSLVEAAIIAKLETSLDGTGITLATFNPCTFVSTYLGLSPYTIDKVSQAFNDAICELKTEVKALQDAAGVPVVIDTKCLTGTLTTRDQILQAVITQLCLTATDTAAIKADYVKGTQLCTLVTACLAGVGLVQENTKMPKYCPIPYYGTLAVFDGSGKGLLASGYDKVYLCIGQTINGFVLPDSRGRTFVGANTGSPGGALDAAVDPAQALNAGYSISKGTKVGEYAHILTVVEEVAHSHAITDPGHTHQMSEVHANSYTGGPTSSVSGSGSNDPQTFTAPTASNTTGITIGSTGGNQPHNTTQPSIGCFYIMYVPS